MNKKHVSILLSLGLVIVFILGYRIINPNQPDTTVTTTSSLTKNKLTVLPTFEELKTEKGTDLSNIGEVQISTVLFQDTNQAVSTDEQGKEISVPLTVMNMDKQEFSLSSIEYSPDNLRIGDTFGLAKKDTHYFAYDLSTLSD